MTQLGGGAMPFGENTSLETEQVAREAVDAIYKIHSTLGPGLLESVYETCLEYELRKRGLVVERQKPVAIVYEEVRMEVGFKIDLLVNGCVLIELKAVERMIPVFDAQLLTYLKLSGIRLGLLVNFNTKLIKEGIRRVIL
jgi:GxxExxY protein